MIYKTTVTKKGQMTLPRELREKLNIAAPSRVTLELGKDGRKIKIVPREDILDMAGRFKSRAAKNKNALKARDAFEKMYGRK